MVKNSPNLLFLIVVLVVSVILGGKASAISAPKGITISPYIQQIFIQSNEPSKTFLLTLTNNTNSLQELQLTSHDFGTLNESGGILLDGANNFTQKYGLTSWMTLGADTVLLQPRESRAVEITLNNRDSLRPGGHYGAVVASVKSLDTNTGNHVAVNQKLLSLILVDKQGGEKYDLKLKGISQNGNWIHLPTTVKLRFQNPGNVHVIPRGIVKLKNPAGKIIARGIINDGSATVLPESFREIYVPLDTVGHPAELPGLYSVEADYRYDGLNKYATKSQFVRYINLKIYLLTAGVIIAIYYVIKHKKSTTQKPKKLATKNKNN